MEVIGLQTKQCLFCAETIQAAAVKCRFCGEFLNTGRAKAIESGSEAEPDADEDRKQTDNVLFEGRPSLWTFLGKAEKAVCIGALPGTMHGRLRSRDDRFLRPGICQRDPLSPPAPDLLTGH